MAGAAAAVTGAFGGAATAVSGAFGGALDRLLDLMPRRDRTARSIPSRVSRRESQRRGAYALLGLLGVVLVLGLGVWLVPRGREPSINTVSAGEQAFALAKDTAAEGIRFVSGDPVQATTLLQRAWRDLEQAVAAGIPEDRTGPLQQQIRTSLDQLYKAGQPKTSTLFEFDDPTDVKALTVGPDGGVYFIAPAREGRGDSVWRLNKKRTRVYEIVKTGDSHGSREIGRPRLLTMTALNSPVLLIVDDNGYLWRWTQYNDKTDGSLSFRRTGGDTVWGEDVRDISTLVTRFSQGLYNVYVLDPDIDQILKYSPTLDGNRFDAPTNYLVTKDESVADFLKLYIGDGNLYTLGRDNAVKHSSGRKVDWRLDDPPDSRDLRPGHRYRLIDGTGPGRLFVYDEQWGRILVFLKSDGSYLEQWATTGRQPSMEDIRGMWVSQGGTAQSPKTAQLTWATPKGIYRSTLTQTAADLSASPAPDGTAGAGE